MTPTWMRPANDVAGGTALSIAGRVVVRRPAGARSPASVYCPPMPRRRWKDVLEPGLDVVFVGYNPSRLAWHTGYHYANPGNRFYHLLHDAGLTPRRFAPSECRDLPRLGIGLADLLHEWSPRADDFPPAAYRAALPTF